MYDTLYNDSTRHSSPPALRSFSFPPCLWPAPVPKNRPENVRACNPTTSFSSAPSPISPPSLPTPRSAASTADAAANTNGRSPRSRSASLHAHHPLPFPYRRTICRPRHSGHRRLLRRRRRRLRLQFQKRRSVHRLHPAGNRRPPLRHHLQRAPAPPPKAARCSRSCAPCAITIASLPSSACCAAPIRRCSRLPTIPTIPCPT